MPKGNNCSCIAIVKAFVLIALLNGAIFSIYHMSGLVDYFQDYHATFKFTMFIGVVIIDILFQVLFMYYSIVQNREKKASELRFAAVTLIEFALFTLLSVSSALVMSDYHALRKHENSCTLFETESRTSCGVVLKAGIFGVVAAVLSLLSLTLQFMLHMRDKVSPEKRTPVEEIKPGIENVNI